MKRLLTFMAMLCLMLNSSQAHVVDAQNRHVSVKQPIKTIASSAAYSAFFIIPLGLSEQLIFLGGVPRYRHFVNQFRQSPLPEDDELSLTTLNVEKGLRLKPDLTIVGSKHDNLSLMRHYEQFHLPVYSIHPESFSSVNKALKDIAELTQTQTRANKLLERSEELFQLVDARLKSLPQEQRKKVYFIRDGHWQHSVSGQTFQHELLEKAGLVNVAAHVPGHFISFDAEALLRAKQQVIIFSSADAQSVQSAFERGPLAWLKKAKKIIIPSEQYWTLPSPMAAPAVLYLASKAYPEQFLDVDVSKEINDFLCLAYLNHPHRPSFK